MRYPETTSEPAIPRGKKLYKDTGEGRQSGADPGTGPDWCGACGLRVRGPNHEEGDHHRGTVKRCGRV